MMVLSKNKNAGFTILEVLITLGILSIVVLSASKLLTAYLKTTYEISKEVDYTQNLRLASNQIMDQIKKTNSVTVVYNGSGLLTVDDIKLLDATPRATNTNTARLWLYDNGSYGELKLSDNTGNDRVIAEYIEYITIQDQPNGKPYVNIKIKVANIEEAVFSVPKTYAFSSTAPPPPPNPNSVWGDFVTFSHRLDIQDATIIGPTSTIYLANSYDSSFSMDNNTTMIKTARVYIEKNLHINNSQIGKDDGSSSIYVGGNITTQNQPKILGSLYYTGSYSNPVPNATKVTSIQFPPVSMPSPQSPSWYTARGFTSNSNAVDGMKYWGGNILFNGKTVSDVCIYSTSNITIYNNSRITGILYAPGGTVEIRDSVFEGIIIADYINIRNSSIVFRSFNVNDLPF